MKVIVWGTGWAEEQFYQQRMYSWKCEVVAYIDSNPEKWNYEHRGKKIYPAEKIKDLEYEKIIICVIDSTAIYCRLVDELNIDKTRILTFKENCDRVKNELCEALSQKYIDSPDLEIQEVVSYYQKQGFNIYGAYDKKDIDYKVFYDEEEYPYVIFEGKRMYYPKNYSFATKQGELYVENILGEQQMGSPHLYLRAGEVIPEGSVVVDAGVCEGNFALRYIDKVKKLYLIESDPMWVEVLKKTFREYDDKVIYCNKFLGRYDNERYVTLDSLVEERIDFLKMDIEGAEIDALLGAKNVLERSNAHCAICSYHKQRDEQYIRYLLENYGYTTSTSEGYMFFIFDNDIYDSLDFRKGIVYGSKAMNLLNRI